jgi:hypothetical protein
MFKNADYEGIIAKLENRELVTQLRRELRPDTNVFVNAGGQVVRSADGSIFIQFEGRIFNVSSPFQYGSRAQVYNPRANQWIRTRATETFKHTYGFRGLRFDERITTINDFVRDKIRCVVELDNPHSVFGAELLRVRFQLREGFWVEAGQMAYPIRITNGRHTYLYTPTTNGTPGTLVRQHSQLHRFRRPLDPIDRPTVNAWNRAVRKERRRRPPVAYTDIFDPLYVQLADELGL